MALILCAGAWAAARGRLLRVAAVVVPLVVVVLVMPESPLAARVSGLEEDLSTLERIVMIRDTFMQIAGSPIFGSAFIELNSGIYPHNVLLEAGLALGIPLAFVLATLLIMGAMRAWRTLQGSDDLLGLLFLQVLIAGMLSDALFAAAGLWSLLALLLGPAYTPLRRPASV